MSFVKAMEAAATSAEVVANFIGSVDEHLRIKEIKETMALLDIMAKILFNSDETFSPIRIKVAPTDST